MELAISLSGAERRLRGKDGGGKLTNVGLFGIFPVSSPV
jgi:hypothetical protein